jgi:hypothetical protein
MFFISVDREFDEISHVDLALNSVIVCHDRFL